MPWEDIKRIEKKVNCTQKEYKSTTYLKMSIATLDISEAKNHFLCQQAELADLYQGKIADMDADLARGKALLGVHDGVKSAQKVSPPMEVSKDTGIDREEHINLALKLADSQHCLTKIAVVASEDRVRKLARESVSSAEFNLTSYVRRIKPMQVPPATVKSNTCTPKSKSLEPKNSEGLTIPPKSYHHRLKRGPNVLSLSYLANQVMLVFSGKDQPYEVREMRETVQKGECNIHNPTVFRRLVALFELATAEKPLTPKMVENLRLVDEDIKKHDIPSNREYKDPALEPFIESIKDKGWY